MGLGIDHGDLSLLFRAADALAEVRTLDELRHRTVTLVPELVPSSGTAWNELDLLGRTVEYVVDRPELDFDGSQTTFMENVGDHPVIAYYRSTGDGRPMAISDFLSVDEFHATGLYEHFYRRLGAEDQISFVLPEIEPIIGVAANRAERGYSERERTLLNLLRPHVVQAYRSAQALSRAERLRRRLEAMVEERDEYLVLLDGHGRVEHATPAARAVLARWFGDSDTTLGLPVELEEWLDAPWSQPGPEWPFVRCRGEERLVVRRLPDQDGTALLISLPDAAPRAALTRLGLSARESQVLLAASNGLASSAIAARLGISVRTVHKHFQRIYDKLGVPNRLAATNLLHQIGTGE